MSEALDNAIDLASMGLRVDDLEELLALPKILPNAENLDSADSAKRDSALDSINLDSALLDSASASFSPESTNPDSPLLDSTPLDSARKSYAHKLESYAQILLEWSATHNLTGAKTLESIRTNIIDSALPLGFIEDFGACFDVGSGAGFPGIPLAILRPQSRFILCEPRQKRAAFLSFVVQKLGLANISVIKQRAESYTPKIAIDLITSRAALPSARLFALTEHIAQGAKTRYLLYKGAQTCDIPRAKLYQRGARIYAYL